MAGIWNTRSGNLGMIPDQFYYELQLSASDSNAGVLSYSIIAGELPNGLTLSNIGLISGNPNMDTSSTNLQRVLTKEFTVRLTAPDNTVNDRTFSLSVSGVTPPVISPNSSSLGTYIAGDYANISLTATDVFSDLDVIFSLKSGQLPPGVTLYSNGAIQGYILPISNNQTANVDGFDESYFDQYLLDFSGVSTSRNYQFSVEGNDGINYDFETYTIFVYDREALTADTDQITADNDDVITADDSNLYSPILYTEPGRIANVTADNNFAYQFDAIDLNGDDLSYAITSGTLPAGLSLQANTGWITGVVEQTNLNFTDYTFNAQAFKTQDTDFISENKTFVLRLLGELDNDITWITSSNLGNIDAGSISELSISASASLYQTLNYKLASNSIGALPPGLQLQSDGLIIGRPSFFADNYATANLLSTFTVVPYNQNIEFTDSAKTFSLQVFKRTTNPYDNLYIDLLPSESQRQYFEDIIHSSDIAPNDILYRPSDLWFGRNTLRRVLFLSGLQAETASNYINAMTLNHYWKTLLFGQVKTARATDENLNTTYEVVYLEIIDQQVNSAGLGPNLSVTWPTNTANISTVYPNSFPNMVDRLVNAIQYADQGVLPDWMTSRQEDGRVLGFTRAMVLFYTKPGKSKQVAYRVNQVISDFNLIDFTIDRYEWDNTLSKNEFVQATGQISGNIESNIITGISGNINGSGTITTANANAFIIGTGTIFGTQLEKDKPIYVAGNLVGIVDRIFSNTNVKLKANATSTIISQPWTTTAISTKFDQELKLGDTIIVNDNVIGTVKTISNATSLILESTSSANIANANYIHVQQDLYYIPGQGTQYLKFPQTNILS